ncbi:hypothetical protein K0651_12460 [Ornithinimicrobium sp. Arc0846-15]|nr:hypothetical protein [Ornithinimicrobium laminariae]
MSESWVESNVALAFGVLFMVAILRGQATYWIARSITEQALRHTAPPEGWRADVHAWLQGEGLSRGRALIQRWGLVAVPLCYLTVGFQTLVLAAAGVMRLRWAWFTLVQVPGSIAWATIYTTIGFAVWRAGLAAAAGSPWGIAVVLVIVVVLIATGVTHRVKKSRPS